MCESEEDLTDEDTLAATSTFELGEAETTEADDSGGAKGAEAGDAAEEAEESTNGDFRSEAT
jgi:hypothetical protein